jgi:guanylate kinase
LFIVSAPSGAGKTSLVHALVARDPRVEVAISHTTREARPGEMDGCHYHFVDAATFLSLEREGLFLESAQVFGNRYGTSREAVSARLAVGQDVVLEIDWQGAAQVKRALPEAVGIFILPPSRQALAERLAGRGQDSADVITQRMQAATREISHWREFDYLVVNDDFETAVTELHAVIVSNRLRCESQARSNRELLDSLLESSR